MEDINNIIAPAYSDSKTYSVGDYCIKDGYMYRCHTAISVAETWTTAHWIRVNVGGELSKTVWNELQNLTTAQQNAARNNIRAADEVTVAFHTTQIGNLETGKQDKLTFDSTPTAGSNNPVTSAGIKTMTDALTGDVDDLKSAFRTGIVNGGQLSFVRGGISGSAIDYTNTKRIITANDITLEFDMVLRMKSGSDYLYAVFKNENGAYSSLIGWSTGEKRIEAGTTFRIMIRNTNTNATVTVDKADELEYFYVYTKDTDSLDTKVDGVETNAERMSGCVPITFTSGKAIDLGSDPVSLTPSTNGSYMCYSGTCSPGYVYTINGTTGSQVPIYSFLDSSYNRLLPRGVINSNYSNRRVTAPANAAYIVINLQIADDAYAYKGENLPAAMSDVRASVTSIGTSVARATGCEPLPANGYGYIDLDSDPVSLTPVGSPTYNCVVAECAPGDVFTITGKTNNDKRIYAFLDAEYIRITGSIGAKSADYTDQQVVAPADAAYIAVNFTMANTGYVIKGEILPPKVKLIDDLLESAKRSITNEYESITEYYVSSAEVSGTPPGEPINSNKWLMRVYDVSKIVRLLKVGAYSNSNTIYCVAFYSSDVLSSTSFISGVKFRVNSSSMQTFENIDIPDNAVKCAIMSRAETNTGIVIDALAVNTIDGAGDKQYFLYNDIDLTETMIITVSMGSEKYKNMIVSAYASYETTRNDDEYPTIHMTRRWPNSSGTINPYYSSPKYAIGGKGHYTNKQWRFPPYMDKCEDYCTFTITVPEGVTLHIRTLANCYDNMIYRDAPGIRLNAHGFSGFGGPAQTLMQFEMAARLGYQYCITIPKVTSDGVYVCLHDDGSIQATARNDDGTAIASEYQNIPVSGFTYAQLLQFDFGIYRGQPFKGERIPTVADFFKICARTGMHPMFSVHPSLSTDNWANIKALAKKYGVLGMLNIKAPCANSSGTAITNLSNAMQVFGNEVESYTIDVNSDYDYISTMNGYVTTYSLDRSKVRLCIEFFEAYATDANISNVQNAGYDVAVAFQSYTTAEMLSYIEKGVTEFTEDYNCSVGLNW